MDPRDIKIAELTAKVNKLVQTLGNIADMADGVLEENNPKLDRAAVSTFSKLCKYAVLTQGE